MQVDNKKKICLVIPSLQAGGMERVMSELARYFSNKPELEIHLVLYGISPVVFYQIPGIIIIHKPGFTFNNRYRLYYTLKTLFYLRKEIIRINPVAILSFGEYWNNFVLLSLLGLEFPVYVSDRCQPDKNLRGLHNILRKILYKKTKGIIVQTEKALEIYKNIFPGARIYLIGNPIRRVDTNDNFNKDNIILSVGRLIKSKNYDELIKVFVKLNAPDWKLIIVGGDALKQQNLNSLKLLVKELNAESKVIFTGYQKNVDNYYRRSKIFAFMSSSEGFPNVIGEALSAGLPVVAYDCVAGPSEMINDGENGFLVPVFDNEMFKEKLQLLIDNEDIRKLMSKKAKESVNKFSIEVIGEKYLKLLLS